MNRQEQILHSHAGMIVQIVKTVGDVSFLPQTKEILKVSEQNGWGEIVSVMRKILDGERDQSLLNGLDEEDSTIIESILLGIQNPATLPDPSVETDASMAAPGIAQMVHQASTGNVQALEVISQMAEQMSQAGGEMRGLGNIVSKLIDGERNPVKLCQGMGTQGRQLVDSILEELNKLALQ